MRRFATLLAFGVALWVPSIGRSATLDVQNVTGGFDVLAAASGATFSGEGTGDLDWGLQIAGQGQSGYSFAGALPGSHETETDFILGTFTHHNQPIVAGTSITRARLDLTINLVLAGQARTATASVDVAHWETSNGGQAGGLCADGGANFAGVNVNGCADRVQLLDVIEVDDEFVLGNVVYALQVTGFLQNGEIVPQFWTSERQDNSAVIMGRFVWLRDIAPVPLPAAGWLLLAAISGLGWAGRHKRKD
ncbi:VPLPA-CTERM sorting domain-containing protein [Rhodobacter sp. Har01]|uniref:choice-of-anchor K domain-containing protein n=1 Tax=Rhodobacter sp. Har01 TaxID=2883999 RepID=UPI001D064F7F|nr:choice-of-anchor K domain-containing protein [Rhodobacter sp. Har01]MCB6179352.1 VPLPA-CTERM sorting domain-containing protein [Rhodobacter sp. Har01]